MPQAQKPEYDTSEFKSGYLKFLEEDHSLFGKDRKCKCRFMHSLECNNKTIQWDKLHTSLFYEGYKKAREDCEHLPPEYRLFKIHDLQTAKS